MLGAACWLSLTSRYVRGGLYDCSRAMMLRQVLLLGLVAAASAGKSTFGFYDEKRHG